MHNQAFLLIILKHQDKKTALHTQGVFKPWGSISLEKRSFKQPAKVIVSTPYLH